MILPWTKMSPSAVGSSYAARMAFQQEGNWQPIVRALCSAQGDQVSPVTGPED